MRDGCTTHYRHIVVGTYTGAKNKYKHRRQMLNTQKRQPLNHFFCVQLCIPIIKKRYLAANKDFLFWH